MTTLERSILINASADVIDTISSKAERWPEWYAGVQNAEPDGVFPEVGGIVQVTYKSAGVTFKVKFTQLEFEHGQHSSTQMDGMITGVNRVKYTPEGEGTRVTFGFEYEMPGGGLGKVFDKLLVERMNADNLEKSLENLKALVEG